MKRILVVFGLCLGMGWSSSLMGEETESHFPPPSDPQMRARIEKWLRELGDADGSVRDRAFERLVGAGEEGVYVLVPASRGKTGDLEIQKRAKAILEKIGWVPAEVETKIRRQIRVLQETRDRAEWEEAIRRLVELERPGFDAFEKATQEFPDAKGELTVRERDEGGGYEVVLRNTGEKGFWIKRTWLNVVTEFEPVYQSGGRRGELERAFRMMNRRMPGRKDPAWVLENPPPYFYLASGEELVWQREPFPEAFGTLRVKVSYHFENEAVEFQKKKAAIRMGWGQPEKEWWLEKGIRFEVSQWKWESEKEFHRTPPLRSAETAPAVKGLKLTVSLDEREAVEGFVPVRLRCANAGNKEVQVPLWTERNLRGLWYVRMNSDGEWIEGETLQGTEEEKADGPALWKALEAGEVFDVDLLVPMPDRKRPETFLVVGYQTEGEHSSVPPFLKGLERIQGNLDKPPAGAWKGTVFSNALNMQKVSSRNR